MLELLGENENENTPRNRNWQEFSENNINSYRNILTTWQLGYIQFKLQKNFHSPNRQPTEREKKLNNSIYPECRPKIPQNLKHTFPVGEWIHEPNGQFWKFLKEQPQMASEYLEMLSRTSPSVILKLKLPSDFISIQPEQLLSRKQTIIGSGKKAGKELEWWLRGWEHSLLF